MLFGGRPKISIGMIIGIPASIDNKYVPGSGVGASTISARRAKSYHATHKKNTAPTVLPVVPGPPTAVIASLVNGVIIVSWTAPTITGSAPITSYAVTSSPGAIKVTSNVTTASFSNLTNGTAYTFSVIATNNAGNSIPSISSSSITAYSAAAAPTVTVKSGNGKVTVTVTAPSSTGGSPITNYQYSTDGGATFTAVSPASTSSTVTVSGLINGTTYAVQIRAITLAGFGAASTSVTVTPVLPKLAGSVLLNGTNQYLTLNPGVPIGGSAYTVECWFKPTDNWFNHSGKLPGLLGTSSSTGMSVFFANNFTVTTDRYGGTGTTNYTIAPITANEWHHFVLVRNSANIETVFIDGIKATSGQQTNALVYTGVSTDIGHYYGGFWDGYLTNFRIASTNMYDPTNASIAVPTMALTSDSNTKYLMLGAVITTDSANPTIPLTNVGSTTLSTDVPF